MSVLYAFTEEERFELIGEKFESSICIEWLVQFDEPTQCWNYGKEVGSIYVLKFPDWVIEKYGFPYKVGATSIDDASFGAEFKETETINFSYLIEKIEHWLKRQNYRHINIRALEDYCKYLAETKKNIQIDWN